MKKPHVLITRPADDALPLADAVEELGYFAVIEPMLQIAPQDFVLPDDYQGLVFTSANAARVAGWKIEDKDKPVYCVAGRTAETAKARGWNNVISADGDVAALNALLAKQTLEKDRPLVHLSGVDVSSPVEVEEIEVNRISVYKAEQAEKFSADCFDLLMRHEIAAVLFFSTRTAEAFAALVRKYGCQEALTATKALCLADSMVESIRHLPWQHVQVAQTPDRDAVVALLDKVEDKTRWQR